MELIKLTYKETTPFLQTYEEAWKKKEHFIEKQSGFKTHMTLEALPNHFQNISETVQQIQ